MTLEELLAVPGEVLTCAQVAPFIGANPGTLHDQALEDPSYLGFPVIVAKSRVKIPKRPFYLFMTEGIKKYENQEATKK